jgi:hypothetical protein
LVSTSKWARDFSKLERAPLNVLRDHYAEMPMVRLAEKLAVKPPSVARLESNGAVLSASVGTLRKYLGGLGYVLRLVAVPTAAAKYTNVIEPIDPSDPAGFEAVYSEAGPRKTAPHPAASESEATPETSPTVAEIEAAATLVAEHAHRLSIERRIALVHAVTAPMNALAT